ncbi:hypothetical protein NDU88_002619 [Pleurodeles waltl]|uniref:Uncharacterized protein n=1 Tax=Pleurodeles waltl TaxID=8319 RepID=A0AAV7W3U9_PLEWA|nr:hypothetical protein NDU88_002619 [Pleurodeles waltl]
MFLGNTRSKGKSSRPEKHCWLGRCKSPEEQCNRAQKRGGGVREVRRRRRGTQGRQEKRDRRRGTQERRDWKETADRGSRQKIPKGHLTLPSSWRDMATQGTLIL